MVISPKVKMSPKSRQGFSFCGLDIGQISVQLISFANLLRGVNCFEIILVPVYLFLFVVSLIKLFAILINEFYDFRFPNYNS